MNKMVMTAMLLLALSLGLGSPVAMSSDETPPETILLVSLEDGTVIKQVIHVDAEICFKQINISRTTCLIQGAPIIDAATNTTIGFEMIENTIELVAKSD